jgi:chromosome segregation ATPase
LRIRTEYLGKRIACKHCRHTFRAEAPPAPAPAAPSLVPDAALQHNARLQADLQKAQADLAARTAELARAIEEKQRAEAEAANAARQLQAIQSQGSAAEAHLREELAASQAACKTLTEKVAILEPQVGTLEAVWADRDHLAERKNRYKAEYQRLTETLAVVRKERKNLIEQREEEALHVEQLRARITLLEQAHKETAAAHGELTRQHQQALSDWQTERRKLTEEWTQRQRLEGQQADERLQARIREHERAREEAAGLQQQVQQLRSATEKTDEQHRLATTERRQALAAARREVLELRARVAQMPALQAELQQAQDALTTHTAEHKDAVEELQRARDQTALLEWQVLELRCAGEGVEARHQQENQERQQALAGVRRQAAELREQLVALQALQTGAADTETRQQAVAAEAARLAGEIASLQQELTANREEAGRFRARVAELEEQAGRLAWTETELLSARGALAQAEHAAATWQEQLAQARTECEELRRQGTEAAVRPSPAEAEREAGRLAQELTRTQQELVAVRHDAERLRGKLTQQQGELYRAAEVETRRQQAEAEAARLQQELAEAHQEAARLREVSAELEKRAHQAAESAIDRAETERLQQELAEARQEATRLREATAELEQRAHQAAASAADRAETERMQRELTEARQEAARLRELSAELEERAHQGAESAADLHSTQETRARLEKELASSTETCRQLTEQLTVALARAQDMDTLRGERDKLAQRVEMLQTELDLLPDRQGQMLQSALDAVFSGKPKLLPDTANAETKRTQQRLDGVLAKFAQEREQLQNELGRLRQENIRMRQWLGRFGVQMS